MPGIRSASIGVWVGVGSRDEARTMSGASHFLEHLLFKGTSERSALDISVALDEVGTPASMRGCSTRTSRSPSMCSAT
jgi:predicted Zn-dependent peptidase